MKLLLLTGSFFLCTLCNAQFNASVNLGYSIGRSATAGLDVGYNLKQINFHGGFYAHLSDQVSRGLVTYIRAGHTFDVSDKLYIAPNAGYAFLYKSADRKDLNSHEILYGAEFGLKTEIKGEPIALYLGAAKAGEMSILSVGIRGFFN